MGGEEEEDEEWAAEQHHDIAAPTCGWAQSNTSIMGVSSRETPPRGRENKIIKQINVRIRVDFEM